MINIINFIIAMLKIYSLFAVWDSSKIFQNGPTLFSDLVM